MLKRHSAFFIILTFTGIFLFYYYLFNTGFFPIKSIKQQDQTLNAFTNSMESKQYNQKGEISLTLTSPHSKHFSKPAVTTFINPQFTLPSANGAVWHIQAKKGKSTNSSNKITLWNNVILNRPGIPGYPQTTISTQELTYYKAQNYAVSNSHTQITQPGNKSSGNHIKVDLNKNVIYILDHPHGTFDAPHSDKND